MQAGRWQPLDACVEVDISHTEDLLTVVALREAERTSRENISQSNRAACQMSLSPLSILTTRRTPMTPPKPAELRHAICQPPSEWRLGRVRLYRRSRLDKS